MLTKPLQDQRNAIMLHRKIDPKTPPQNRSKKHIVDEKLVAYFHKYISKESNKGRIFKPSMTLLTDDEDIDETDLDEAISDLMIDAGVSPSQDEPTEEVDVEVDYSEMSPREIQDLIDDALDAGDFDTVGMLSKYL